MKILKFIYKLIRINLRGIALVAFCTAIGGIFGHAMIGFWVGIAITAFATMIF